MIIEQESKMGQVAVYTRTVIRHNLLEVDVGTNCPQGGDSGHGGRTVLRIKDLAATDMFVRINGSKQIDVKELEIILGGDSEHETLVEALSFALAVLKGQTENFTPERMEEVNIAY